MPSDSVTVLVVDDQPPFRAAAKAVVRVTPGFEVLAEADSGEAAVEQAAALEPDVVLMDINLPGINGIEATRRIMAARPCTVVILLSTYRQEDLPHEASTCGAVCYANKEDFGPNVLVDAWDRRATTTTR